MQWNAQVTFEADDENGAANTIKGWGLAPGTSVIVSPAIPPFMGTVDEDGNLSENAPFMPPEPPAES